MQSSEHSAQVKRQTWCVWSTVESIQNEVPSLIAIFETIIAVPLYWWLAIRLGTLLPLLVSAAVVPLVLLRSEASLELSLQWFRRFEEADNTRQFDLQPIQERIVWWIQVFLAPVALVLTLLIRPYLSFGLSGWLGTLVTTFDILAISPMIWLCLLASLSVVASAFFPFLKTLMNPLSGEFVWYQLPAIVIGLPLGMFVLSLMIRIGATLAHLRSGIETLPQNFRRIAFCTSPTHVPELVPGLETTDSGLTFRKLRDELVLSETETLDRVVVEVLFAVWALFMFFPAWLYRLTIKATAWFWWPLAFLGGELRRAQNPELFHWKVLGSLWAKASIALSCCSVLAFVAVNLLFRGAVFRDNPLLAPIGYLLLFDWTLRSWQVCALVGSLLSIILVFLVNDVSGEYRIAQNARDAELLSAAGRKFGWIERLARFRLLILLLFWGLIAVHALLYANSQRCWFSLSPNLQKWAEDIYGDRLPPDNCGELAR